ncbi:hypothetical protein ACIP9H_34025 [Streptomyces sp. NPDC088732]|uniref:hypothetical protein n=1 Tax=Streptomyces sp. NPDC088732 TaxID=3365879 RepID=UPI003813A6D7
MKFRRPRGHWTLPLTHHWFLVSNPVKHRWRVHIGRNVDGRTRSVKVCVLGRLFALLSDPTPCGSRAGTSWFKDFGRWSVGGWRTGRTVPVSSGWATAGNSRVGVYVTVASRTFLLFAMLTRAEYRANKKAVQQ